MKLSKKTISMIRDYFSDYNYVLTRNLAGGRSDYKLNILEKWTNFYSIL